MKQFRKKKKKKTEAVSNRIEDDLRMSCTGELLDYINVITMIK